MSLLNAYRSSYDTCRIEKEDGEDGEEDEEDGEEEEDITESKIFTCEPSAYWTAEGDLDTKFSATDRIFVKCEVKGLVISNNSLGCC